MIEPTVTFEGTPPFALHNAQEAKASVQGESVRVSVRVMTNVSPKPQWVMVEMTAEVGSQLLADLARAVADAVAAQG